MPFRALAVDAAALSGIASSAMFSAVSQKNCAVAKSYFDEHLTRNDYHQQGAIEPGRWFGLGAERLGLVEGQPVDRAAFLDLCENRHPSTGKVLTQRMKTAGVRRVFFDFTCSAPKSVSILAVTMNDERLVKAHRDAARFAAKELEAYAAARIREDRRDEDRATSNTVGAEFVHNSSRALDPQLHTHFTLFNATFDATEQRWKALQSRPMFDAITYGTEVYRNDLVRRLHAIGYETEKTAKGFEIKGVAPEALKKFSKRSAQRDIMIAKMEKELGRKLDNNEISHAVHRTRSRKLKGISTDEVRARQLAQLSPAEVAALDAVKQAAGGLARSLDEPVTEQKAMEHSLSHVFERLSVVPKEVILREALAHGRGHLDLAQLKEKVRGSQSLVPVGKEFSTREILEAELFLIDSMNRGKDSVAPLARDFEFSAKMGKDQREAIALVLKSPDQFTGIRGLAGTGKSTALSELARALDAAGYEKIFCAPTGSATDVLRRDGFDAITLQRLLVDEKMQAGVHEKTVIVLDEAGAVGMDDMRKLFSLAVRAQARLVFSGDTGQHSPVARGDALRLLEEHSRYTFGELTEIRRQKKADYLGAVTLAAKWKTQEAFDRLDGMGDVKESPRLHDAAAAAYLDAAGKGKSVLIVAPTWSDIHAVTDRVRGRLRDKGLVHGEDSSFDTLESLQWTAAQKRDVKEYAAGMALVFHEDAGDFARHEVVHVLDVDHKTGSLRVRNAQGKEKAFRPSKGFDVCERHEIPVAAGDKLLVQANRREAKLVNGELVEVKAVQDGRITLKDGRTIGKDFRQFCHGYAVTSHASQGKTVDEVLLVASSRSLPAVHRQQFYVSISRGRERCRIFTDDKELLRQHVGRGHDRRAVLDDMREELLALPPASPAKKKTIEPPALRQEMEGRPTRPLRPLAQDEAMRLRTRLPKMQQLVQLAAAFRSWVGAIALDRGAQRIPEPVLTREIPLERTRQRAPEMEMGR